MKPCQLLHVSVMSAITETQKALNQRYAVTAETFDPFQGDKPGFAFKHSPKVQNNPSSATAPESPVATPQQNVESSSVLPQDSAGSPAPSPTLAASVSKQKKQVPATKPTTKWNAAELRRAVILSEIIGPPLSRRGR